MVGDTKTGAPAAWQAAATAPPRVPADRYALLLRSTTAMAGAGKTIVLASLPQVALLLLPRLLLPHRHRSAPRRLSTTVMAGVGKTIVHAYTAAAARPLPRLAAPATPVATAIWTTIQAGTTVFCARYRQWQRMGL